MLLQADSNSVTLVRDAMVIEAATPNFHLAGNSMKFCKWVRSAYSRPCAFLPSLYYLDNSLMPSPPLYNGGTLRMGAFGATRALKNFTSAAGAALDISRRYKSNLELWVSAGERKAAGETILRSAHANAGWPVACEVDRERLAELAEVPAKRVHTHLPMQPSYAESFNMVTADGVAEGVAFCRFARHRLGS